MWVLHLAHLYNMLQAWYGGLRKAASGEAMTFRFPVVRLALNFLIFILTARGSQVKKKGLVMVLLLPFLPSSLRLSLVVQQQIWVVVTSAVGHHHCADGAGIDVLDLEEAFDYVDVLWFNILLKKKTMRKKDKIILLQNYIIPWHNTSWTSSSCALGKERLWLTCTPSHLEGFIEPEHRAGCHVAYPVQVPRDQVGLIQPAAKHIVRLVPHTWQQRVIFCRVLRNDKEELRTHILMKKYTQKLLGRHFVLNISQTERCMKQKPPKWSCMEERFFAGLFKTSWALARCKFICETSILCTVVHTTFACFFHLCTFDIVSYYMAAMTNEFPLGD